MFGIDSSLHVSYAGTSGYQVYFLCLGGGYSGHLVTHHALLGQKARPGKGHEAPQLCPLPLVVGVMDVRGSVLHQQGGELEKQDAHRVLGGWGGGGVTREGWVMTRPHTCTCT